VTRRRKGSAAVPRLLARRLGRKRRSSRTAGRKRSDLIGRDLAPIRRGANRRSRLLPVALVGALMAALCLAALRIDLIRQGYALAAAMREEKELLEEHHLLTAQVRSLRDPARLALLASRLDFERPERVIELGTPDVSAEPRP
jgi:hypothetical protein